MIDYSLILTINYPEARWAFSNIYDYSTIDWHSDTTKPTQAELEALWDSTQADVIARQNSKANAKSSALAKLSALGLTEDEVKALIS
jgi:hypothetical protein